jgi:phage antirepressor YoqD-like protein
MEGACSIGDFAKAMRHGRNKLFARLRRDGLLMDDNIPYQAYMNRGYFVVVEGVRKGSDGTDKPTFTTMLTGKGQVALSRRYPVGANLEAGAA